MCSAPAGANNTVESHVTGSAMLKMVSRLVDIIEMVIGGCVHSERELKGREVAAFLDFPALTSVTAWLAPAFQYLSGICVLAHEDHLEKSKQHTPTQLTCLCQDAW